jgi:hypothetical protein
MRRYKFAMCIKTKKKSTKKLQIFIYVDKNDLFEIFEIETFSVVTIRGLVGIKRPFNVARCDWSVFKLDQVGNFCSTKSEETHFLRKNTGKKLKYAFLRKYAQYLPKIGQICTKYAF